jgi:hypothetical protein
MKLEQIVNQIHDDVDEEKCLIWSTTLFTKIPQNSIPVTTHLNSQNTEQRQQKAVFV